MPYRLYQAMERTSQNFRDLYKKHYGLTRTEWRVMLNVGQYGPIEAGEISKRSFLHKTKISRAVNSLEKKRWLERVHVEGDRRRQTLRLTPLGKQNFDKLANLAMKYNEKLIESIGVEAFQKLNTLLFQIEDSPTIDVGVDTGFDQ